jgi:hypothetical protein
MGREGDKVQIILTNNYSYTGTILEDSDFFIVILDKFGKKISLGKKDIQVIKGVILNGS